MSFEVHEIPATKPAMARLEESDNPDAWISADEGTFVQLGEATDEEVREAVAELEDEEEA